MHTIYLGLGTNLGDRAANLQAAIAGLARKLAITVLSPIYETPAWGVTDQPDFLNMCLKAKCPLEPESLRVFVKDLERQIGRESVARWGPRLIDIDILFYANRIIKTDKLTIPHPHIAERAFVLRPLTDIAPDFVHPQLNQTVMALYRAVDEEGIRPFAPAPSLASGS